MPNIFTDETDAVEQSQDVFGSSSVSKEDADRQGVVASLADQQLDAEASLPPEEYSAAIQAAGDNSGVRTGLAAKEKDLKTKQLFTFGFDPEEDDPDSAAQNITEQLDKLEPTEEGYSPDMDVDTRNAVDFLIENGYADDEVKASQLLISPTETNSFLEVHAERSNTIMQIEQVQARLGQKVADQGAWTTLGDLAPMFLPLYMTVQDAQTFGRKDILKGDDLKQRQAEFWNLSPKERTVRLLELEKVLSEGDNLLLAMTQFEQSVTSDQTAESLETIFELLDLSGVGLGVKALFKTLTRSAAVSRNAPLATKTAVSVLNAGDEAAVAADEAADAVTASLPRAISPENFGSEPITAKVTNEILDNQAAIDESQDVFTLGRLDDAEAANADAKTVARIKRELRLPAVKAVDVEVLENTGIRRVSALFGHGKSGLNGYSSPRAATNGALRKGIVEKDFDIVESQGKYFIQVQRDASERNVINALDTELTADTFYSNIPFVRYAAGSKSILNFDLSALSEVSTRNFQKSLSGLQKPLKSINDLNKKAQADLMDVLKKGREEKKWFTPTELQDNYQSMYNRLATDKEIVAYYANQQLNDFAFKLRNDEVFKHAARAGYQEVTMTRMGISGNGKVVTDIPQSQGQRVAFMNKDGVQEVFERGQLTRARLEEISVELGEDMQIVKMMTKTDIGDGALGRVQYAIAPQGEVSIGPLRGQQLGYVAGGTRIYKGKNFVKQQRLRTDTEGKSYLESDRTHFAIESRTEAKEVATKYNAALKAFKEVEGLAGTKGVVQARALATELIQQNTIYKGFDDFADALKRGEIEDSPFEVVGDRGVIGNKTADVQLLDDDFENFSEDVKELLDSGSLWYSKKGNHLRHPNDELAPIVDPFEAMSLSVTAASRSSAYSDLKIRAIESWVNKYGGHLDLNDKAASPISRFMNGTLKSGPDLSARNKGKAEAARQTVKRLLHTPTADQKAGIQAKDRLVQFLDEKGFRKSAKYFDDGEFNAVSLTREIAFKSMLGMGDLSQLAVQISMLPGVLASSPIHGLKTMGAMPWIDLGHRYPQMQKTFSKMVTATSGMKPSTYMAMMKDMQKSGINLVGDTQGQLDAYSKIGVARSPIRQGVKSITDKATFAFNTAERWNRQIAYAIAWQQNGGKALKNADDIAAVTLKSEALAGNMGAASNAWWQTGVLSLPTQFQAHPARVFETMLSVVGSGTSGGLSKTQAAGFIGGLTLAYGSEAVPFATDVYNMLRDKSEDGTVDRDQHVLITSGLLGASIPETSIRRVQPFGQDNLVQEIFKGDKQLTELAFGPSGSFISDTMKPLAGVMAMAKMMIGSDEAALSVDPTLGDVQIVAMDLAHQLAQGASSYSRATRGYMAYKHGQYLTKNGDTIDNVNAKQAALIALGFPPANSAAAFEASYDLKLRTEAHIEISKENARLIREALRAEDPEVFKDKMRQMRLNMAVFGNDDPQAKFEIERMTLNRLNNMKAMTEEQFLKVNRAYGLPEALRQFEYRGEE